MKKDRQYCLIQRTGTPEACVWVRSEPMSWKEAQTAVTPLRDAGETVLIEDYEASLRMGLPEGWTFKSGPG